MIIGHKFTTEAMNLHLYASGRGAFQRRRISLVMNCGVSGKANVGISNDKESAKLSHRYSKVS